MFERIRNLIGRKEREPLLIRFDGIPSWLDKERQDALVRLDQATRKEREEIRGAAGRLSSVIQILLAAQFDDGIHPKLRSIAKKSLPLYTKAVQAALEKSLPQEPEDFYEAATELLKACLNSMHGQGKYLRTVFPEEMKAVSASVAEIGRAINAMNQPLNAYRVRTGQIHEAAKLHTALLDIENDIRKSGEKEERINRLMQEINDRISDCERAFEKLGRERNSQDLVSREHDVVVLKNDLDMIVRRYATLSMTASHVLRKAEKVARRQHRPSEERAVSRAIAYLSDHTVPDSAELVAALDEVYVPAKRMIDSGDVALKNKEERLLFSSQEDFYCEIRSLCASYADQVKRWKEAQQVLETHPVLIRHAKVSRELRQLSDMLAKEKRAHAELVQWRDHLITNIPQLREELKKAVGGISVSDVQIQYPDDAPNPP